MQVEDEASNSGNNERAKTLVPKYQYMLDVEFGIEKRRGYICIYICRFCNRGARRIYVFIYVYVYMSRGLHISYLIGRWRI